MFSRKCATLFDELTRPSSMHMLYSRSVNNLVQNGNVDASLTSDDSATRIGIASDGTWLFDNSYSAAEQTFDLTAGDKIYVRTELESSSIGRIMLQRLLHSDGSYVTGTTVSDSLILSDIITVGTSGLHNFKVMESTSGLVVRKTQLLIDLTDAFGTGNEPTKEVLEAWLSEQPNSWFDSYATCALKPLQWF